MIDFDVITGPGGPQPAPHRNSSNPTSGLRETIPPPEAGQPRPEGAKKNNEGREP